MDKRIAKPWYVGVTHVLTSYVTAGIFTFIIVFTLATLLLLFNLNSENIRTYVSLFSSLVFIPIFLFPATKYSVKFIMDRYVISEKDKIIRFALMSIAGLRVLIDWTSGEPYSVASVISFLLSLAVFYGVSVQSLEMNEGKDIFNLKDVKMEEVK